MSRGALVWGHRGFGERQRSIITQEARIIMSLGFGGRSKSRYASGVPVAILSQIAGAGTSALISLGLVILLARALGPGTFGEYVALVGFATWGLVLIDGGWSGLLYRETVPAGHTALHGAALHADATSHVLLMGTLLVAVTATFRLSLGAAIGCMVVVSLSNLVSSRMRGRGEFQLEAGFQLAGRLTSAVAILAAGLYVPHELWPLFLAWAAGLAMVLAVFRGWLVRPSCRLSDGAWLALPFMLVEGSAMLLYKSDVALLRLLGTSGAALSEFAACTRFNEAALLLGAPGANVLLREFRLRQAQPGSLRYLRRWVAATVAAGLGLWLLLAWMAQPVVLAVFGRDYAGAAALLPWTSAALVLALPNLLLAQALCAANRERLLVKIYAAGAIGVLCAVAAGTRSADLRVAAAGLALTHAVVFVLACWAAFRAPAAKA